MVSAKCVNCKCKNIEMKVKRGNLTILFHLHINEHVKYRKFATEKVGFVLS